MPLLLGLFVFWLALQGKLKTYVGFVTGGPGIGSLIPSMGSIASPTSSHAAGAAGVAGSVYQNPALYPSTVARSQNQIQPGSTGFPLGQSAPSSGQRSSIWPFN